MYMYIFCSDMALYGYLIL